MAEVAATAAAMDLGSGTEKSAIRFSADGVRKRFEEAWPACPAVEFDRRAIDRQGAAGANKGAFAIFLVQRRGAGALGALLAQDSVACRTKLALPLCPRLGHLKAPGDFCFTRVSGPHRGGIPFERGSLFHLLKNPVYRGKIVHKGEIYEGEHDAIVDEELWDAVQAQLKEKAPPRKRATNDPQQAMLRGLLTDPYGRPMVPTYATKRSRRYAYYETRKDLSRPADLPATRFVQGQLERHLIVQLTELMEDEHGLRRLSGIEEAGQLTTLFAAGRLLANQLALHDRREITLRSLIASLQVHDERIDVVLNSDALAVSTGGRLTWSIPLPERKPFREARLRIDAENKGRAVDSKLVQLIADAFAARQLVVSNPGLSINQVAIREGRCRKQMAKLISVSWLSPRIVDSIVAGTQPKAINRALLLETTLPVDWSEQETLLGFAA